MRDELVREALSLKLELAKRIVDFMPHRVRNEALRAGVAVLGAAQEVIAGFLTSHPVEKDTKKEMQKISVG
jgi:hypothetical protein